jgi:hypothetical protein
MSDTERKRTPAQADAFQEGSGFGTQRSKPGPTRTRGPRRQIPICFTPYYATGVDGNREHGDAGARSSRSTADHASPSQTPAVTVYCISVFGHVKRRFGPGLAAPMVVLGICEVAIRGSIDCSDGIPCRSTACSQYAASGVDCDRNSIASSGFQQFDKARLMENLVTSWGLHIPKADGIGLRKCGISLFDGSFPRHQECLAAPLPATRGRGGQHCDR